MVIAAKNANIDLDAAYALTTNELIDLQRKVARDAANAEWYAENARKETERLAAQAKEQAAQQAQSAEMDAHAKLLRNFDWPSSNCDRPSFPRKGTNASQGARDRFNRDHRSWNKCLSRADDRDYRAIRDAVRAIDGDWSEADGTISYTVIGKFMPRIKELFEYRESRAESRMEQVETMDNAIDNFNSRQADQDQSKEFWGGINESLDQMSRDMDRMNQQRQQQWNNQIYISPGYD